jgi:hypothetical protein
MKKQLPDVSELTEEQVVTEMLELTCDEMDALTRAFDMLSTLCENLQKEVEEELHGKISEDLVN